MKSLVYISIGVGLLVILSFGNLKPIALDESQSLVEVLHQLGLEYPKHHIAKLDPAKVEIGRQLVYNGRAEMPDGSKSNYISKFYVCTDCHNQVQEDPIISVSNPDTRLQYVVDNNLKFLQATTFWGMVNREFWYNDDYVIKYGSLVEAAHESLAASTQLCARECSSGRYLEEWELEAIMQFYWTLELNLSDLNLNAAELQQVQNALNNGTNKAETVKLLKSKYAIKSPATFAHEPENKAEGYANLEGNAANGKLIWENSCKTCHREYGPSQLILDDSKFTLKKFKRNFKKEGNFNLYTIIRHGTYAEPGHRQYMPLYTEERMSNQQIEDLRAFIESEVE